MNPFLGHVRSIAYSYFNLVDSPLEKDTSTAQVVEGHKIQFDRDYSFMVAFIDHRVALFLGLFCG